MKKLLIIGLLLSTPAFAYDWHDGQGSSYGTDHERQQATPQRRSPLEPWGYTDNSGWHSYPNGQPHPGGYDDD